MRKAPLAWVAVAAASAMVGAGAVAVAWTLSGGGSGGAGHGGTVDIAFERGPSASARLLERSGALARAVQTVNYEITPPTDLHVRIVGPQTAAGVGVVGPVYEPSRRTVYIPWSFIEQSRQDLDHLDLLKGARPNQLDDVETGAIVFVLYHEVAHALIDVLDVPVVASEEQTADSFASVFAIESTDGGELVPLSAAAMAEAAHRKRGTPTLADYADDHGFDRQRALAEVCLVYGSNPSRYAVFVRKGYVPSHREEICRFDYQRTFRSWRRLLGPWLTYEGGLQPLPRLSDPPAGRRRRSERRRGAKAGRARVLLHLARRGALTRLMHDQDIAL